MGVIVQVALMITCINDAMLPRPVGLSSPCCAGVDVEFPGSTPLTVVAGL
jgi:hypothetical protein